MAVPILALWYEELCIFFNIWIFSQLKIVYGKRQKKKKIEDTMSNFLTIQPPLCDIVHNLSEVTVLAVNG